MYRVAFFVPVVIALGLKYGDLDLRQAAIGGGIWLAALVLCSYRIELEFVGGMVMIGTGMWLFVKAFGGNFPTMRPPRHW
jgi:hypothetical protein